MAELILSKWYCSTACLSYSQSKTKDGKKDLQPKKLILKSRVFDKNHDAKNGVKSMCTGTVVR